MPITAEKLQIYNIGRLSDWNCICDADLMLRPDFVDPSNWGSPEIVRSSYSFKASEKFVMNKFFERNCRDLGLSGGFVMASQMCHDVWEYPNSWLYALTQVHNKHLIDEYVIAKNMARYGLHYDGVSNEPDKYIVHFGDADIKEAQKKKDVVRAKELYLDWLEIWPSIASQSHEPLS